MLTNGTFRLLCNREAARNNPFRAIVGEKTGYKTADINPPSCFQTFSPILFFIVHLKGDPIIWFSIIWPDYKSTDMILWICFSVLCTHVLWVCLCVQIPSSSSSSSVFEPSLLHFMASGIQIAIKGLSVSSWCSIDLQQESNPDYEVQ